MRPLELTREDTRRGVLYGLFSAFAFGLMGFLVHCGAKKIPSAEMSFFRAMFGFVVLLPFAWGARSRLVSKNALPIWMRSLAGGLSVLCYFFNLQQTGVGSATALADFSPVFVAIFSWVLFSETLTKLELLGIAGSIAGIVTLHYFDIQGLSLSVLEVGFAGAVFGGVAYVSLRRASVKFSSSTVVCCFSGVTALCALSGGISGWIWPTSEGLALLFGVALTGLLGQVYMTKSYMHLKASVACGLGVSALVWGMGWDGLFHGEFPHGAEWWGYGLLICGVYLIQANFRLKKTAGMGPNGVPVTIAS